MVGISQVKPNPIPEIVPVLEVLRIEGEALLAAAARIEAPGTEAGAGVARALSLFIEGLGRGGKLVILGVGKSGKIAEKIASTLASTGSPAIFLHPTEAMHGDLGLVATGDVAWAISYTGNTEELLRVLPALKARGVPVVGMGGRRESQLCAQSDAWIDASVALEACPHNLAPTSSTTLALALGDALAVALMKARGIDAEAFARNHPGGALGRRLTLRVRDLMARGDALGVVTPDASADAVVEAASRSRLGAVLVTAGGRSGEGLLGVVTEGDIRRALAKREGFFKLRADELMTARPTTVAPETLAWDALRLMEDRPDQISVLPVVEGSDGRLLGLLRLHDLVRTF